MSNKIFNNKGFTLLEAIVAMTVFAVGLLAVIQVTLVAKASSEGARDTIQVSNYLQEGLEATRSARDSNWTNVNTDGTYHLVSVQGSNPPWQLVSGGTETLGKYSRTITISPVMRQDTDNSGSLTAGDKIVISGGTLSDPETKKITVTVTWRNGTRSYSKTMAEYLTNWIT